MAGHAETRAARASRRLWWVWILTGIVAIVLATSLVACGCSSDDSTTAETTRPQVPQLPVATVAITERQNGSTIVVGTGWIVMLQLPGNSEDGSVWNVHAVNADLIKVFPGPQISYPSYVPSAQALFTYSGLTLSPGDAKIEAENVSLAGDVNSTFGCTIRILSAADLATTTTVSESTTTESSTTTTEAKTTTSLPTTTTTGATTTTTASTTTTTAAPTTTTQPPPTTTKPPTTTTTKAPTTTTLKPPPPTVAPPSPPIDIPDGAVLIGPKANGQIQVVPTTAPAVVLGLLDDTADNRNWELYPFDSTVLRLREDPTFVPHQNATTGYLVWFFNVVGPGATDLKLVYRDSAGDVSQQFFVSVSVQQVTITPF